MSFSTRPVAVCSNLKGKNMPQRQRIALARLIFTSREVVVVVVGKKSIRRCFSVASFVPVALAINHKNWTCTYSSGMQNRYNFFMSVK